MSTTVDAQIKEIKCRFRQAMNGVISASMREKGILYPVNFGLTLPLLKKIADSYPRERKLAERLWKEPVRESKMLATWLYPPQEMDKETACRWVKETPYPEIADLCCMNLFPYIAQAKEVATTCIRQENEIANYTGYRLWYRLLSQGQQPSPEERQELLTSSLALIDKEGTTVLCGVALDALIRLAEKFPSERAEIISFFSSAKRTETNRPFIEKIIEECRFLDKEE
ncbi:MAG: DNA alkylation repair protein [Porphyromonadaceae bacterium]|nr:DNA alkylation repair protein [Porphyromonadaceae bacterium]